MAKKLFTAEYQPQGRGRRQGSKNRKTIAKAYLESVIPNGNDIDAMSVKTFIVETILQKDKHSVVELELLNTVVKDLLEYQLMKPDKEVVIINESNSMPMSTNELIANFVTKGEENE